MIVYQQIGIDDFKTAFPLVANPYNADAPWAGCQFAATGDELAYVMAADPLTIWSVLDGDQIVSGYQADALGYLVSSVGTNVALLIS